MINESDYKIMLEECRDRLNELLDLHHKSCEAYAEYFDYHGWEHSIEHCPQDDTCECPESEKLFTVWRKQDRKIELAYRRVDKINRALDEIEKNKEENK